MYLHISKHHVVHRKCILLYFLSYTLIELGGKEMKNVCIKIKIKLMVKYSLKENCQSGRETEIITQYVT